ncbi:MAG: hypothetical protein ACFFDN_05860 [Candidatus Hodarchaeota archaeon]
MPKGLALFGWTNKEGFFLIDCVPKDIKRLLDDETVMRIGSLHRLRKLDPNFLTLNLPNFKIASFFSGMKTARYIITPNFTLTLLLDLDENPHKYPAILPTAAKEVLKALSGEKQRFDTRTARMSDVLTAIGEEYKEVLPKVFNDICNDQIQHAMSVEDLLDEAGYAEEEISEAEKQMQKLRDIIDEKDGMIKMLQKMLSEQEKSARDTFGPSLSDYTSMVQDLQNKLTEEKRISKDLINKNQKLEAQIERAPLMENKLRSLQADLRERDTLIKEQKEKIRELEEALESGGVVSSTTTSSAAKTSGGRSRYIPL